MLLRASKRILPHDGALQGLSGCEPLPLPFLCPALYKRVTRSRRTTSQSQAPSKLKTEKLLRRLYQQIPTTVPSRCRGLASAAAAEYAPQDEEYIPFEAPLITKYVRVSESGHGSFPITPAFDLDSSPLILEEDTLVTQPEKFRARNAISGDLNEIHQTLHACLQVGRLERAAVLIRRLNTIYKSNAPGLLAAHNEYIRDVTLRIVQAKDEKLLKELQTWFEVDMRGHGVPPDAATYALMIQASQQEPNKKKLARTIRRYLNFARESGVEDETMALVPELERTLEVDISYKSAVYRTDHIFQDATKALEDTSQSTLTPALELERPEETTILRSDRRVIPQIRGVAQKGAGLSTLKQSLAIFASEDGHIDALNTPAERQRLLERNTLDAAIDRWRAEDAHLKSIGINNGLLNSSLGAVLWKWHGPLVLAIKDELKKANEAESKEKISAVDEGRLSWGPYLQTLSPEKISASTILTCMKCVSGSKDERGTKLVEIVSMIGESLYEESIAESIKKNNKTSYWRQISQPETFRRLLQRRKKLHPDPKVSDESTVNQMFEEKIWSPSILIKIGAMLFSKMQEIAQVEVSRRDPKSGCETRGPQPAFFHSYQYQAGRRIGIVRLNSAVTEQLSRVPVHAAFAKHLPMVAKPRPWTSYREGGFLEHPVNVVRLRVSDVQSRRYALAAIENGDMSQVFAGLDTLAQTPWRINRGVFDVMLEAWNTGEAIAKIPAEDPVAEYPPEPAPSAGNIERQRWIRKIREIENRRSGLRSERCFQNFQLEVARAYLDETFYFPHNVDFRGRAYPMAPFLNHMGSDNCRGLLLFDTGKELGVSGLRWLKIHLANVYGYDKASFEERRVFADEHIEEIRESVANPLKGSRWWLQAEDPWQCLAACMELTSALHSPDPTKFVSHLAIHQDGTCNGLQHYAALGGDTIGAKQVNLEPGDRPSDIYTAVSELIKVEISKEAANGDEIACYLDGKLTRKVVKQTVMTNVYGVTFVGAKRQVHKQLEDLLPGFPETPTVNISAASRYVAKKIFRTLSSMFSGAHDIQYWLGDCAARICESISPNQVAAIEAKHDGTRSVEASSPYKRKQLKLTAKTDPTPFLSSVIWTTPLKMPVVQPYRKYPVRKVATNLQTVSIYHPTAADPIDKARQLQAFPPNFIHSLDGTHMFLTALKCRELGLTFASVHDSFWTHATDVDTMNKVTRDAFICMHTENIVARLGAEFKTRYKNFMHLTSVKATSAAGMEIKQWRDETPKSKGDANRRATRELLLETRRLRLLASQDPKEREEGASMVTPASIYAELANEKDLAISDHEPTTLGGVSLRQAKLKANEQLEVGDKSNTDIVDLDASVIDVEAEEARDIDGNSRETETADALAEEAGVAPTGTASVLSPNIPGLPSVNTRGRKKPGTGTSKVISVWVPLTFPPVPEKVCISR